jgi:hypothetical protein
MTVRTQFALVGVLVGLAACNEPLAPDPMDLDDLLGEVAQLEAFAAVGAYPLPSIGTALEGCAFIASSQSFVCQISNAGVTMTRSFQLLDASDTPQSAFDPATTAAIRTTIDMTGTTGAGTAFPSSILHHNEQTVSGLLTTTRTVSGESSTRFIRTSSAGADTLTTSTTVDFTVPRRTNSLERIYPTGTVATTASGAGLPAAQMSVTTTFNGTSTATLAVSFGVFSQTCTLDLDEPDATPTCG